MHDHPLSAMMWKPGVKERPSVGGVLFTTVHRYCGSREEITEEVVALAEHHVKRLREWFQSYKFKNRSRESP